MSSSFRQIRCRMGTTDTLHWYRSIPGCSGSWLHPSTSWPYSSCSGRHSSSWSCPRWSLAGIVWMVRMIGHSNSSWQGISRIVRCWEGRIHHCTDNLHHWNWSCQGSSIADWLAGSTRWPSCTHIHSCSHVHSILHFVHKFEAACNHRTPTRRDAYTYMILRSYPNWFPGLYSCCYCYCWA